MAESNHLPGSGSAPKLTRGLAFRQARLAILLAFSLGVLFSLLQIFLDFRTQKTTLGKALSHHAETMSKPAAEALWYLNEDLAKGVIDGLFGYAAVEESYIASSPSMVLASRVRATQEQPYRWLVSTLFGEKLRIEQPLLFVTGEQSTKVGKLIIVVDPYPVAMEFLSRAATTMLTGLVRNLLLAVGLFGLFFFYCTRQIVEISSFLRRLDPRSPDSGQLQSFKSHQGDELGQLVSSVNTLIHSVEDHGRQRDVAEQALVDANLGLEETVESRTRELELTVERLEQQSAYVYLLGQVAAIANSESDPFISLRKSLYLLMNLYQGPLGAVMLRDSLSAEHKMKQHWFRRQGQQQASFARVVNPSECQRYSQLLMETASDANPMMVQRLLPECAEGSENIENTGIEAEQSWLSRKQVDRILAIPVFLSGDEVARLLLFLSPNELLPTDTEEVMNQVGEQLTRVFERKQTERRLLKLARTDPLTGILNRRAFEERALSEFSLSLRHQRELAVVIFDIDDFKRVNDSYGHAVGDKVITEIVGAANLELRKTDLFGRFGGEEFVLMLSECGLIKAIEVTERIRRVCQKVVVESAQQQVKVTITLGVSMVLEEDTLFEEALGRADDALYQAKKAGKNCSWFYDPSRIRHCA